MTIREVAEQVHMLTHGKVNGEHYSKGQLYTAFRAWMRNCEANKLKNRYVIQVSLPDGDWLATIDRYADQYDGYDYWIPDTREQEARIYEALGR